VAGPEAMPYVSSDVSQLSDDIGAPVACSSSTQHEMPDGSPRRDTEWQAANMEETPGGPGSSLAGLAVLYSWVTPGGPSMQPGGTQHQVVTSYELTDTDEAILQLETHSLQEKK